MITNWIGQQVRHRHNRWLGRVTAMTCLTCGYPIEKPVITCPHNDYRLTVNQDGISYPWEHRAAYEDATVRRTVWAHLLEASL